MTRYECRLSFCREARRRRRTQIECYRAAKPERRLLQARGTQFDPRIIDIFLPLARAEMTSVFAAANSSVSSAL
jgi:hypothetical protein